MAHNLKGLVFQKMDLLPDAVASFEQAVKLVPDDMNFQFNLAVACFDCGDKQRADEILSKVLDKTTDQELRERVLEYKKKIKE